MNFPRIQKLPPYIFSTINDMKYQLRREGRDIIDFSMGNPDQPPPPPIVEKLIESARKSHNHRYSASRGITKLREAITDWYKRRFNVTLDPESEAIVTIGSKEGIAHLVYAILDEGDTVLCPDPTYPIHAYSVIIAGGIVRSIPFNSDTDLLDRIHETCRRTKRAAKLLILNFPHNPTTAVVDRSFFEAIVEFAHRHNLRVIHDLAYADLCFDGYQAPSLLEINGAQDIGVEFFTLSKSYNMPGWRVGFCVGNRAMIAALARIKSYLDYGLFQPIQIAAIHALNGPQRVVDEICETYRKRRDTIVQGLQRIGWDVDPPKATMFLWAKIPEHFRSMGSLEFSKFLLTKAGVAVSPGIGFGRCGDDYVRFALIENEHRIRQAVRNIKKAFATT